MAKDYSDPVSSLLSIGDPREITGEINWWGETTWLDYPKKFGLMAEHVPELIRMATDEELNLAMSDTTDIWAPLHAWRALGQLRAVEAVRPLLGLFHRVDDEDDEWILEDQPEVMAMIGPAAISPIGEYLADIKNPLWARVAAAGSLEKIGTTHPASRTECIAALATALENFPSNDEILNGELVGSLAELDAVEAASLVEQAYKADRVDESILGDWEDFQVEVGLLEKRITDPDEDLDFNPFFPSSYGEPQNWPVKKEAKKTKKKRKQATESRKKNRKKKK